MVSCTSGSASWTRSRSCSQSACCHSGSGAMYVSTRGSRMSDGRRRRAELIGGPARRPGSALDGEADARDRRERAEVAALGERGGREGLIEQRGAGGVELDGHIGQREALLREGELRALEPELGE